VVIGTLWETCLPVPGKVSLSVLEPADHTDHYLLKAGLGLGKPL
jgi:hypothetical protein